jgi:hypothetical protein
MCCADAAQRDVIALLGDPMLSALVLPALIRSESAGEEEGLTFEEFKAVCFKAWKVPQICTTTVCVLVCICVCTCVFY